MEEVGLSLFSCIPFPPEPAYALFFTVYLFAICSTDLQYSFLFLKTEK